MIDPVPVARELFEWSRQGASLTACRCAGCGHHYFPLVATCRNPRCRDKRVERVAITSRGHLYSYTLQSYRPPALFRMEQWAPYALGIVEFPEGLRVMGMITGCPPAELRIGLEMEITVGVLYRGEEGQDVLTYMFRPSRSQSVAS